jgi:hypothetical protein
LLNKNIGKFWQISEIVSHQGIRFFVRTTSPTAKLSTAAPSPRLTKRKKDKKLSALYSLPTC